MSTRHTTIPNISSPFLPSSLPKTPSSAKIVHFTRTSPEPDSYFGVDIYTSPEHSDDDHSDSSSDDGHSDSTLEECSVELFGHPLERMPRIMSADHGFHYEQDLNSLILACRSSRCASLSESIVSTTSGTSYDSTDYDKIVDDLLILRPDPFEFLDHRNLIFPEPGKHTLISCPPLMIKRLQRSSSELRLLLELNRPEIRDDPWNAAPHILRAVERADDVHLCLPRLSEYNQPPLLKVAHYIDFFRQILEGLSSFHERHIAGLSCADPSSYMVDLSSASQTTAIFSHAAGTGYIGPQQFDRVSYPVKYYLVNYVNASYIQKGPIYSSSTPGSPTRELEPDICPFKKDVQDCATMIDGLLSDVPKISLKFKPLIKAMTLGGFTADDSRRLFEALCRALEAPIFETAAQPASVNKRPERPYNTPHPNLKSTREQFRPLERVKSC